MTADTHIYLTAGGYVFYFPAVHIWRRLNKNLILMSLPKAVFGIDLLRWTEEIRLEGIWLDDDVDKQFDSITAFKRYNRFFTYFSKGLVIENGVINYDATQIIQKASTLTWGTFTYLVLVKTFSITKSSGEGTMMNYTICLVRVTQNIGDLS